MGRVRGAPSFPAPQGIFWAGTGSAEDPPRERKSQPSSPQAQRLLEKKQEVKWAPGRNTGQPRSGMGLERV